MNTENPENPENPEAPLTHTLNPKTLRYLNSAVAESEKLFGMAVEYRAKFESAKTSIAKEMYGKKLKKIVSKLDRHMALFSALEQIKAAQETSSQDESVKENR